MGDDKDVPGNDNPPTSNDNNQTGSKIDIGDGKSVVIESDLGNMHPGGHVPLTPIDQVG